MDEELFYEMVDDILINLEEDCEKEGLGFDRKKLYWSLDRDSQLSIESRFLFVYDDENIDLEYNLPRKFGVYRNYLGGGISGKISRGEVDTGDEKIDKILENCLALFYKAFEKIEKLAFSEETEYGMDRFQDGLRIW